MSETKTSPHIMCALKMNIRWCIRWASIIIYVNILTSNNFQSKNLSVVDKLGSHYQISIDITPLILMENILGYFLSMQHARKHVQFAFFITWQSCNVNWIYVCFVASFAVRFGCTGIITNYYRVIISRAAHL